MDRLMEHARDSRGLDINYPPVVQSGCLPSGGNPAVNGRERPLTVRTPGSRVVSRSLTHTPGTDFTSRNGASGAGQRKTTEEPVPRFSLRARHAGTVAEKGGPPTTTPRPPTREIGGVGRRRRFHLREAKGKP